MDFGKAFMFVRDDEGWIAKLLVGALMVILSALIIPSFILLGYQIAIIRNVMQGEEHPLPSWGEDIGKLLKDGLMVFIGGLVYALPIILLSVCNVVASAALAEGSEGAAVAVNIAIGCLIFIFAIGIAFIAPAIYIQYARTDELGALFRFGEVIAIARENVVDILLTLVANWVAGLALMVIFLISFITICGWIVVILVGPVWITYALSHLYGQIGAKGKGMKAAAAY